MHAYSYTFLSEILNEILQNGRALETTIVLIWEELNSILENITIHGEIALKTKSIVAKLFACTFHTSCKFFENGLFFKRVFVVRNPGKNRSK